MLSALASPTSTSFKPLVRDDRSQFGPDRKPRVLIVDDSRLVRSVFYNTLSENYDCTVAGSYVEAVDFLKLFEFELVIADVIMPGLSGTELLRKIIDDYPKTLVIMVSGVDRPQRALDALRLGAFDYLIKPCELPVLELTVERALKHSRLLRSAEKHKVDLERHNAELVKGRIELNRLQGQVVQNEKMAALGQVAAGIAHELNNPVAFVHGNLDILGQTVTALIELITYYETADLPAGITTGAAAIKSGIRYKVSLDDLNSIIEDCREGTERIRDIVQNLRTFSRLDEAEFKKADINAGIDSTIRLLSQYFNCGNITLVREFGELPEVDAFGGQLNQVWMNLLVNAAQSIGNRNGEVRVRTRLEGEFVLVTIGDTGVGIAKQDVKRIFDPFYTSKSVGEGTGLGLSICFGIVERHGGQIAVESTLGQGTEFTVRLPISIENAPDASETGIDRFEVVETDQERFSYELQIVNC